MISDWKGSNKYGDSWLQKLSQMLQMTAFLHIQFKVIAESTQVGSSDNKRLRFWRPSQIEPPIADFFLRMWCCWTNLKGYNLVSLQETIYQPKEVGPLIQNKGQPPSYQVSNSELDSNNPQRPKTVWSEDLYASDSYSCLWLFFFESFLSLIHYHYHLTTVNFPQMPLLLHMVFHVMDIPTLVPMQT